MISPLFRQKRPVWVQPSGMHPGLQVIERKGLIRKRFLPEFPIPKILKVLPKVAAGLALAIEVECGGLEIAAQIQLQTVAHPPGT